jgi:hypothetical protein
MYSTRMAILSLRFLKRMVFVFGLRSDAVALKVHSQCKLNPGFGTRWMADVLLHICHFHYNPEWTSPGCTESVTQYSPGAL